jgi:hypothetical protein
LTIVCALAQDSVPPEFAYQRLYARVPMIGAGTKDDPRRPMFVPVPSIGRPARGESDAPAIISFQMQESDDKQFALVEFVAADPDAFKLILQSTDPRVKAFVRGRDKKEDIEAEFKKHKRDFSLDNFGGKAR